MAVPDKRNFERPDEFIPERWTTETNLTKDASVFMPFSVGVFSSLIRKHSFGSELTISSHYYRTLLLHRQAIGADGDTICHCPDRT